MISKIELLKAIPSSRSNKSVSYNVLQKKADTIYWPGFLIDQICLGFVREVRKQYVRRTVLGDKYLKDNK